MIILIELLKKCTKLNYENNKKAHNFFKNLITNEEDYIIQQLNKFHFI